MTRKDERDRIWDIIEGAYVCMLTTGFAVGLRARPMEPRPDRVNRRIFFVTDRESEKLHEVEEDPQVGLVLIDHKQKAYLSITGTACVSSDRSLLRQAWRASDEVWWPQGPDDPRACVLIVLPRTGELWDGPTSAAAAEVEFAKARATGDQPNLGENRKITVRLRSED